MARREGPPGVAVPPPPRGGRNLVPPGDIAGRGARHDPPARLGSDHSPSADSHAPVAGPAPRGRLVDGAARLSSACISMCAARGRGARVAPSRCRRLRAAAQPAAPAGHRPGELGGQDLSWLVLWWCSEVAVRAMCMTYRHRGSPELLVNLTSRGLSGRPIASAMLSVLSSQPHRGDEHLPRPTMPREGRARARNEGAPAAAAAIALGLADPPIPLDPGPDAARTRRHALPPSDGSRLPASGA